METTQNQGTQNMISDDFVKVEFLISKVVNKVQFC